MPLPAPPGDDDGVPLVPGVLPFPGGKAGLLIGSPAPPGTPGDVVSVGGGVSLVPGVVLSGVAGSGAVGFGDGAVSELPIDGVVFASVIPPGQRELSGKRSHKIFMPSEESLISGILVSVLVWAKATLVVTANANVVQMMVKYFAFTPINLN